MAEAPARPVEDHVDRLVRVLAIARSAHLPLTLVVVGDIRLVLAGPAEPQLPGPSIAKAKPAAPKPDDLEALRKRARVLFGRELSDEELREMKGAL